MALCSASQLGSSPRSALENIVSNYTGLFSVPGFQCEMYSSTENPDHSCDGVEICNGVSKLMYKRYLFHSLLAIAIILSAITNGHTGRDWARCSGVGFYQRSICGTLDPLFRRWTFRRNFPWNFEDEAQLWPQTQLPDSSGEQRLSTILPNWSLTAFDTPLDHKFQLTLITFSFSTAPRQVWSTAHIS